MIRPKFLAALTVAMALVMTSTTWAGPHRKFNRWAWRFARVTPWHHGYAYTPAGRPVPLVVPPTARMEVSWGWGVAQSASTPIYHQFQRPMPDVVQEELPGFRPTPAWPSHTRQFGVYYVRGPW